MALSYLMLSWKGAGGSMRKFVRIAQLAKRLTQERGDFRIWHFSDSARCLT
jgi:hypothetical protein